MFPPVDNPIFAGATHALAQHLAAAGYTLLLASHDYDLDDELAATRALVGRGADGMVLVGLDHRPETLADARRARASPTSSPGRSTSPVATIASGSRTEAPRSAITQHLLDLGHREFAVIAGDTMRNDRARERLEGVRDALAARGDRASRQVAWSRWSSRWRRDARRWRSLLQRAPGFTAVIGGNDPLAIGALLRMPRRGIDVPDAMSIAGFDDIELAGELSPGLTTIHVPSAEIGREAGRRLLARLAGKTVPVLKEMPAPLIVRGTTGPPPRAGAGREPIRRRSKQA